MIIRIIGKQALRRPSTTDQIAMPYTDWEASFSGIIPIAGAANRANRMVTISVINALFHPDILSPIINTKSRMIGINDTNADIGLRFIIIFAKVSIFFRMYHKLLAFFQKMRG